MKFSRHDPTPAKFSGSASEICDYLKPYIHPICIMYASFFDRCVFCAAPEVNLLFKTIPSV